MRKRFKNLLFLIGMLIVISLLLGLFYFIYKKYLTNDGDIKITGNLSINYHDGSKLKIKGSKKTSITLINDGDEDIYYYIEFINVSNADDVKYSVTDNDLVNIEDKLNNFNTIISSYNLIKAGQIIEYDLSFKANKKEKYSIEINIEKEALESNTFSETILKNNVIKNNPDTTIGKEVALKDEGLIKSVDDNGTTYYFRGDVQNNNVLINDLKFKIVRINGDGSVRLVLDGATDELKKYYDDASKYYYKDSNINTYLNAWITQNLGKNDKYLATTKYCNDVLLNDDTFYSYTRIIEDNIPSFICLSERVSGKIALLTVDEAIYAGATVEEENKSFYLYNKGIDNESYLMSSAKNENGEYYPFALSSSGKIVNNVSGNLLRHVRPVITIIKTASVSGMGTIDDPYMLTN